MVKNKDNLSSDLGNYICSECSDPLTFFNHEFYQCIRCDKNVSGCESCSNG